MELTLCKMLNQLLHDLTVAQRNVNIVHWNLKSETFIFLHEYLGEVYQTLVEYIDQTAEQVRFKGQYPEGKLSTSLETSMLQEIDPSVPYSHAEAVEVTLANIKYLKALTDDIITFADNNEMWDVVDTFTGHTVYYAKALYFLENSLVQARFHQR